MHTSYRKFFRIDRRDLAYLKFIIEAYEGIAVLSTADREGPIIQVTSTPSRAAELDLLLAALAGEVVMSEVQEPQSGKGAYHA